MVYKLPGLSFREFIELKYGISFQPHNLSTILEATHLFVNPIHEKIKPLKLFTEYLQHGHYPFFLEHQGNYIFTLINIVNQVLENDLPTIFHIDFYSVQKIKKMLLGSII